MPKANIIKITDKLIDGERIVNPAYNNPEIAKEIADDWKTEDLKDAKVLLTESQIDIGRKAILNYFGKEDLANKLISIQPIFYDENKIWWVWDLKEFKWKITDETNILNFVNQLSVANTIKSKEKSEILESLKQKSRIRKPEPIKKTWIQFKNKIFDIETGEEFDAKPYYFVTNPIPYQLHPEKFENTPVMDRIFEEWVGKDYVQTLYEIIAYCLIPNYPIHRLFCFIGGGLNGKSCFLNLLRKFIGGENCCSTELDVLLSSRFEVTRLHKKLVCQMGETNFNEMSKTSILKKLTGGDLVGFEYKNKNPFEETNYAKILISTNNLPTTTDKTIGFYRRWMIIDFPNQFSEKKDILTEIPEEEYEALALKSLGILNDLLKKREFHNEGSVEERIKIYEDHSDPLGKFLTEFVDTSDPNANISKWEFAKNLSQWCDENKVRKMADRTIARHMRSKEIDEGRVTVSWYENDNEVKRQIRSWLGVKWREKGGI